MQSGDRLSSRRRLLPPPSCEDSTPAGVRHTFPRVYEQVVLCYSRRLPTSSVPRGETPRQVLIGRQRWATRVKVRSDRRGRERRLCVCRCTSIELSSGPGCGYPLRDNHSSKEPVGTAHGRRGKKSSEKIQQTLHSLQRWCTNFDVFIRGRRLYLGLERCDKSSEDGGAGGGAGNGGDMWYEFFAERFKKPLKLI